MTPITGATQLPPSTDPEPRAGEEVILSNLPELFFQDRLPTDLKCEIFSRLDPTSRRYFLETCKGIRVLKQLFPFGPEIEKETKRLITAIRDYPKQQVPEVIDKIIKSENPSSEIEQLTAFCKARDTLIVMEALATEIHQNNVISEETFKSPKSVILKAQELNTWLEENAKNPDRPEGVDLSEEGRAYNPQSLDEVEYLDLQYDALTYLPDLFEYLPILYGLDLSFNYLTYLPDSIGELIILRAFHLRDNLLTHFPDTFGQLSELFILDATNNWLTHLPDSFGQLSSAQEIFLGSNTLTHLPDSFGQLSSLKKLNLKSNNLTHLPDSFRRLTSLFYLNLSSNQFIDFPEVLNKMPPLLEFIFENNLHSLKKPKKKLKLDENAF